MASNKILVKLSIPAIEKTYDLFIPINKKIGTVKNLIEKSLTELGITEEMFCLAAKKGLENPVAKKYFEQLISFTNYNYFKSLMTKRNIQLEEMAMSQMNGEPINNKKKIM